MNLLFKLFRDGLPNPECLLHESRGFCLFPVLFAPGLLPHADSCLTRGVHCVSACTCSRTHVPHVHTHTHMHTHSGVQAPQLWGGREGEAGAWSTGQIRRLTLAHSSVSSLLCPAGLQRAHWGAVCALLCVPEPRALLRAVPPRCLPLRAALPVCHTGSLRPPLPAPRARR